MADFSCQGRGSRTAPEEGEWPHSLEGFEAAEDLHREEIKNPEGVHLPPPESEIIQAVEEGVHLLPQHRQRDRSRGNLCQHHTELLLLPSIGILQGLGVALPSTN